MDEKKKKEFIERIKADFCGTMMEGIDVDCLYELPHVKSDLPTDVDEIRK